MLLQVLIEALVVGVVLLVVGYVVSFLVEPYFGVSLPTVCKSWNKKYVFEVTLFLSGFLTHIVFELLGANDMFCKKLRA